MALKLAFNRWNPLKLFVDEKLVSMLKRPYFSNVYDSRFEWDRDSQANVLEHSEKSFSVDIMIYDLYLQLETRMANWSQSILIPNATYQIQDLIEIEIWYAQFNLVFRELNIIFFCSEKPSLLLINKFN